jgi:hypothetical protein
VKLFGLHFKEILGYKCMITLTIATYVVDCKNNYSSYMNMLWNFNKYTSARIFTEGKPFNSLFMCDALAKTTLVCVLAAYIYCCLYLSLNL